MNKFFLLVCLLLTCCAAPVGPVAPPAATPTSAPILKVAPLVNPASLPTATVAPLPSPTPNPTIAPSPTPVLLMQGPGLVFCPILLYHRIAIPLQPSEYYVSPDNFRAQMQALKDWGYTPIPVSLLISAIKTGALLPERPVVLSFDDGDISVYTTAFPIMREFGFAGINYLVSNRLAADGYLHPDQIHELAQAGWEVGSHSMDHVNLLNSKNAEREIEQSRIDLEAALGLPVTTFAYPFGAMNASMRATASRYYTAAMGLGPSNNQSRSKLFYLWRRPVDYQWDLETFHNALLK